MSYRNKLLLPIAIIICLLAVTLFACATPPGVESIEVVGDFATVYKLGEELDTSGMKLKVTYSDQSVAELDIDDVRKDIVILGFNTTRENTALEVTLTYKKKTATFTVMVLSEINSTVKFSVDFVTGEDATQLDPVEVFAFTTVSAPTTEPQRSGYYFAGWYAEPSYTNLWDFNTTKITGETVLYAKWGKLLTVTFAPPVGQEYLFTPIVKTDVREGETYNNRPPVPPREGYTARWDYNGEWNDLVDNTVIHARYTLIQYKVVFYFMNESDKEESVQLGGPEMTFTYGQNVLDDPDAVSFLNTMPRPSRKNYHISGWKLKDSAGGESETFEQFLTNIRSDVHIMAVYRIDTYNVTFDFGAGEDIEERYYQTQVAYGTIVPAAQRPEAPEREKHVFDGWFADQSLTIPWNFNTGKIEASRTLYAKWTRVYTLVFHGFDGEGDNGGDTKTIKVREGESITPPAAKAPVGHTAQWDRDTFEDIRQDDYEIYPRPPVPNKYTVRFVNYDNTPIPVNGEETQIVSYGEAAIAPTITPIRERYRFLRWSTDFSFIEDNMTITAEFEPIRYTVAFVTEGGDKQPVIVNSGNKLEASMLEIASRSNYDFDGWFKDSSLLIRWNIAEDTVEEDITLYAKWTQLHIVRFHYKSAQDQTQTVVIERKVRQGETVQNPPVMDTLPGLNGSWSINDQPVDLSAYYVFAPVDVVAKYAPAVYTVYFRSEGVDFDIRTQVPYNTTVTAPATNPEKEGHYFVGWNNNPETTPITKDTYFDALFEPRTFRVRFIDAFDPVNPVVLIDYSREGGLAEISYGGIAPAPRENPSHPGWMFIGWGTIDSAGSVQGINSNITGETDIYAKYAKSQYNVVFVSDHDNYVWATYTVEHGAISPIPEGVNPTRTGYTFEGWNYFSAPIVANTRITAIFVINTYTINLYLNGGTGAPASISGEYNTFLPEPATPEYEGKAFLGWYTDPDFKTKYVFYIQRLSSSFNLYARWEDYVYGDPGIVYNLDASGKGYIVTSAPAGSESLTVANYYSAGGDMLPVTAIGYGAFAGLTGLRSVTLPETLSFIGPAAFYGCTSLESITIPDSVTAISQNAFNGCVSLESVIFGENSVLREIGAFAFNNASSLKEITLPSAALETIGERAFSGASALETIVIPASVNDIAAYAFAGAVNLMYAKFVETAPPRIANTTFEGHSPFFRVYVANLQQYYSGSGGWMKLRERGMIYPIHDTYEQAGITSEWAYQIILTGGSAGKVRIIQYIGDQSSVTLGSTIEIDGVERTVAEVGPYAFDNKVLTLSLNSDFILDPHTLSSATELRHLKVNIKDDFFIEKEYISEAFRISASLTELSLSARNMTLEDFFLNGVPPTLRTVNILEGATELPENMFLNAQNLTRVTLPSTLVSIGDRAFKGCISLEEVVIASEILDEIGTEAFDNCLSLSLADMTIPASVTKLGVNALRNTAYLSDIVSAPGFNGFVVLGDNILYLYQGTSAIVRLPRTIKVINDYAFYRNTTMRTFIYQAGTDSTENALREIRSHAFDGAINLEHIILPAYVETIGAYAFTGAGKLSKAILFSENAPTLGANAFSGVMNGFEVYSILAPGMFGSEWSSFNIIQSPYLSVYHAVAWVFDYTSATRTAIKLIQYFGDATEVTLSSQFHDGNSNKPVSSIADYAFPRSVEKLTISASVPSAGSRIFNGLTRLNELTILNSDNIIINKAYLYNLLAANPGLTVLNIGGRTPLRTVFNNSLPPAHLKTVNILSGETQIATGMFEDCQYIESINIPTSVSINNVGADAFKGSGWERLFPSDFVVLPNQNLLVSYKGSDKVVHIPASVNAGGATINISGINRKAFYGNDFIENIYIDSNVSRILSEAFGNMSALSKLFMSGQAPALPDGNIFTAGLIQKEIFVDSLYLAGYASWSGVVSSALLASGNYLYEEVTGGIKLIQYTGPETAVAVPAEINGMPVVAIGNNVFFSTVTSLTLYADDIPGSYAFSNLRNLTAVAVLNTDGLTPGIASQMAGVFAANNKLRRLSYKGDIPVMTLLNGTTPPNTLKEVVILEGAAHLAENMLAGATGVNSITLPEGIQSIGVYAFEGTEWFNVQNNFVVPIPGLLYKYKGTDIEVIIPAHIKVVNEYAFANKDTSGVWRGNLRVETITFAIGSEATEIRDYAFYGSSALKYINLPDTLRKFAPSALTNTGIREDANGMLIAYGDSSAILVKYSGTASAITVPSSVTTINAGAFAGKTTLASVLFTNSRLRVIGERAFENCTTLSTIELPSSVTYIAAGAFKGCTSLSSVYVNAIIPSELGTAEAVFSAGVTIYVPADSFTSYEAANGWKDYTLMPRA